MKPDLKMQLLLFDKREMDQQEQAMKKSQVYLQKAQNQQKQTEFLTKKESLKKYKKLQSNKIFIVFDL